MEYILRHIRQSGKFGWLYLANVFFGLFFFLTHYINSSFLATFIPEENVGVVFAIGSMLAILGLGSIARILEHVGNTRTVVCAAVLQVCIFLGLATQTDPGFVLVLFALSSLLSPLILFCMDIFLETYQTSEASTGNTRGIFLSIGTGTSLFAAAIAGFLAGPESKYWLVYLVAALCLIPYIAIIATKFRTFPDPAYKPFVPLRTLTSVYRQAGIRTICFAQFLLRFFFSWMVVYMPIYLHTVVGFSWPTVGLILSVMLIPYVLVEIPAGIVADKWLGEKELLILGFVITAASTALLSYVTTPTFVLWAGLLFTTRIGAAFIEIMTESYFFKHTKGTDADAISFFRMQRPLAYVLGPLSASLTLFFVPLSGLWLILGFVVLVGAFTSLSLVDTK